MSYYKPKFLAIVSVIVSIASGTGMPMLGYFMCQIQFLIMIGMDDPDFEEDRDSIMTLFLLYILVLGFIGFVQKFVFSLAGENLTFKIRYELFESLIHKQVAWFDRKSKAPGIISNMLSEDISNLLGLSTNHLSMFSESATTIICGLTMACIFSWQMSLVTIVLTPFIGISGVIMSKLGI